MKTILIIEDDVGLREGIELALRQQDMAFASCGLLEQAREILKTQKIDLVLLDINLPDGSGYDLLKEIRAGGFCPVIILTANDLEMDEVRGLELGADDYITKPFSLMVLRARISRVFRTAGDNKKLQHQFGSLFFDFSSMRFLRNGEELILSRTEQKLLQILVENKGIILTRDRLTDYIWDGTEYVDENALSVTVNRLRGKLEENTASPVYLHTVYAKGYVWKDTGEGR